MPVTRTVSVVTVLIGVLAAVAAAVGLFEDGAGAPVPITTAWGESAALYGRGLYRHDTLLLGSGNRGVDAVVLLLGVPLLLIALPLARSGSRRGLYLLTGALAFMAYVYVTMSFGAAYNELFLVYIALMGLSLAALTIVAPSLAHLALPDRTPRRSVGAFLIFVGVGLLAVWAPPIVAALVEGGPPPTLQANTTIVTFAIDLGIIAPAAFVAGGLLLRRRTSALPLSAAVLTLGAFIGPCIGAATIAQVAAGVTFTPGEIAAFIVSFSVLSGASVVALVAMVRALGGNR